MRNVSAANNADISRGAVSPDRALSSARWEVNPCACSLDEDLIFGRPFGRTTGKQHQGDSTVVSDLMMHSRKDNHGVARVHRCFLIVDLHQARAAQDMIEFFRHLVEMFGHGLAHCDSGFGEALLFCRGVSACRQLANNRLVGRYENGH
jgi:hypothetical protein